MNDDCDVLVVDDEPVVRDAIAMVLDDAGYRVVTVNDAESALVHPAFLDCRLVICDLMLPGRSGFDTLRAMRLMRPNLPFVMITGYATHENSAGALDAGATAFLAKPFDDSELLTLVRHALAHAHAAGEEDAR